MTERTEQAAGEPLSALLARGEPSRPAFVVPESGQVLTYAQVADGSHGDDGAHGRGRR